MKWSWQRRPHNLTNTKIQLQQCGLGQFGKVALANKKSELGKIAKKGEGK
jgi:hypothetical protein